MDWCDCLEHFYGWVLVGVTGCGWVWVVVTGCDWCGWVGKMVKPILSQETQKKSIQKIQQKRKMLRMELKTTKNKLEKRILLGRLEILKEYITDKLKKARATKISKVVESVKNNIDNGG